VTLDCWGNSLGLCVPQPLPDQLRLGEGSKLDLKVENGCLIIEPERKRRLSLKEVLRSFGPNDRPGEAGLNARMVRVWDWPAQR